MGSLGHCEKVGFSLMQGIVDKYIPAITECGQRVVLGHVKSHKRLQKNEKITLNLTSKNFAKF